MVFSLATVRVQSHPMSSTKHLHQHPKQKYTEFVFGWYVLSTSQEANIASPSDLRLRLLFYIIIQFKQRIFDLYCNEYDRSSFNSLDQKTS